MNLFWIINLLLAYQSSRCHGMVERMTPFGEKEAVYISDSFMTCCHEMVERMIPFGEKEETHISDSFMKASGGIPMLANDLIFFWLRIHAPYADDSPWAYDCPSGL